ncbi:rod shape-determining protein MreC [Hyphococcus sp.]|uniref:rod shape-determining protein MreC n=1 Tax=Hyphococcus sp. TaxID=2038636 RepID=UPI003CCB78D7
MEFLGQDRREGLGRKAHSRFNLILLMLVSVLLLLSSLYSAQASVFKKAREGVMDAASPVLTLFAGPIGAFNNAVGSVGDYFSVMEQNKALREENAELRQWMAEALELREVVASYEALQGYRAPPEAQPISAYVIGEANDAFARSMIVNAGRANNVEVGQAVVDANGLIGRIVEAGGGASRVLLLTDIQSRVPVYVEGADVEGILVGNTRENPAISFTASAEETEAAPGQRVLTSGAGGALPRGLPVGVVRGEERGDIIIDLYANYARTRMVRVINYAFPEIDPVDSDVDSDGQAPVADGAGGADGPGGADVEDGAPQTPAEG